MTDSGRKVLLESNEDRLPWLEPVDEAKPDAGVGAGKLAAAVIVALIVIGLLIGGIFWMRNPADEGQGDLIAAPKEPYKVKPENPGGMQVEGQGDTAYAASEGRETDAKIDVNKVPEEPVEKGAAPAPAPHPEPATKVAAAETTVPTPPAKAPAPEKAAAPAEKPAAPAETAAAAPAAPSGPGIQLGAFSSEAKANAAWKNLSKRFSYLQPLTMGVQSAKVGDKTIYRLRASGPDAKSVCAKLRAAGESCTAI